MLPPLPGTPFLFHPSCSSITTSVKLAVTSMGDAHLLCSQSLSLWLNHFQCLPRSIVTVHPWPQEVSPGAVTGLHPSLCPLCPGQSMGQSSCL